MNSKKYSEIIRNMPCCFCSEDRYTFIAWHHIRGLKIAGTGQKPPDWATIPVCQYDHDRCHNGDLNTDTQKLALMQTWQRVMLDLKTIEQYNALLSKFGEIDVQQLGRVKAWEAKGKIYWEAIGGEV